MAVEWSGAASQRRWELVVLSMRSLVTSNRNQFESV